MRAILASLTGVVLAMVVVAPAWATEQRFDPPKKYVALSPPTVQLMAELNRTIAQTATLHGARVADISGLASTNTVCTNTFMCSAHPDIHPSDAGYAAMADDVWTASGYARLIPQKSSPAARLPADRHIPD
jgi:hypothetical protein